MKKERTLSIIKPDATARNLSDKINALFTQNGLKVVAQKKIRLTKDQAEQFYAEHSARSFYASLVEYMTSGDVIVQVLEGENAINLNRELMGATNPANAKPGTIRALYAESIDRNSVHGSDSPEAAQREISFFFKSNEL